MNDKTITIYNHHRGKDKSEKWQRTVIRGVGYSYSMEKTVSNTGALVLSELLTVVILDTADTQGRKYIDRISYEKLEDASDFWTINQTNNQDMIVCGECVQEVGIDFKLSDFKKNYEKCGVICGFSDNTDKPRLKHFKVVCK